MVIAADIREQLSCYKPGALGNYATAMAIVSKLHTDDIISKAMDVKKEINKRISDNHSKMLILACYLEMIPELIDAVTIATIGNYTSYAGEFVGSKMFGYKNRTGYCVSNLGKVDNPNILEGMFIPPSSPANKLIDGVLTVNGKMKICRARSLKM